MVLIDAVNPVGRGRCALFVGRARDDTLYGALHAKLSATIKLLPVILPSCLLSNSYPLSIQLLPRIQFVPIIQLLPAITVPELLLFPFGCACGGGARRGRLDRVGKLVREARASASCRRDRYRQGGFSVISSPRVLSRSVPSRRVSLRRVWDLVIKAGVVDVDSGLCIQGGCPRIWYRFCFVVVVAGTGGVVMVGRSQAYGTR